MEIQPTPSWHDGLLLSGSIDRQLFNRCHHRIADVLAQLVYRSMGSRPLPSMAASTTPVLLLTGPVALGCSATSPNWRLSRRHRPFPEAWFSFLPFPGLRVHIGTGALPRCGWGWTAERRGETCARRF